MSIQSIEMSDRFVGMPGTMQGGYIAGLAADGIDGPTRVRIRRPIHPGDILKRTQIPNGSEMYRENELVLIAQRSSMHIEPPVPTDISAAKAAMHSDLVYTSSVLSFVSSPPSGDSSTNLFTKYCMVF